MADPKPCPVCGKPSETRFRPFCSARCANVDLGRWLTGQYRVPVHDRDDAEDDHAHEPPD